MTGSAWPQNGHSKSPYSTIVTGASSGPRVWSRSGSTSRYRSVSGSAPPASAGIRSRRGSRAVALKRSHVSSVAISAAAMMPIFASARVSPSKASDATRSETVNPIPAIAPPPTTAAQPTGGRRRRG